MHRAVAIHRLPAKERGNGQLNFGKQSLGKGQQTQCFQVTVCSYCSDVRCYPAELWQKYM